MATPYSMGEWYVKEGREEEFVELWQRFADWTVQRVHGSTWVRLLRDLEDPRRFISFGPWADQEAIDAWQEMPEAREYLAALRELVEGFEPRTLELAGQAGPDQPDADT
ncbi:antibiotic biosynthesis monooxygenase [Carbonactinospora thermoautotrophica]|uniref:ABM domain-containing protein n=1 Tax=Carbonactinospora thermoautotrophica TaxID=1469144 RepID=A0A132MRC1_9ACTN|nr:antibiotic biosynthesis monooxygenase family protein [Carbonactinospora thermoautotrophica]KWX00381.1 hypothetical protein TH66_16395 [Carbonactinospora thermoautotrophica]KWX08688.1 hypothetical protein TR74_13850 [Carbonactinospora thermoautotrophica]MCX9190683.1 antibiotic biosynthesis monooxygenase [Carbonactinospora thermoautotrophica]